MKVQNQNALSVIVDKINTLNSYYYGVVHGSKSSSLFHAVCFMLKQNNHTAN